MEKPQQQTNYSAFYVLISVFFFWGFVAASNSIFIPFCKEHFKLDQIQSQLIGAAYYGAYFYGSLILYILSLVLGFDVLNRIGYKKGIIYGLLISVVGAILLAFVTGGENATFAMILVSFFIIALGFSLQQTSAQPFAISLGSPETGAHRLNMAGGINSFGTLMGPIVVSVILFGSASAHKEATIGNIQFLYFFLAGLFAFAAVVFAISKLPKTTSDEEVEKSPKATYVLVVIGILFLPVLISTWIETNLGIPKHYLIYGSLISILAILFWTYSATKKNKTGWGAMAYPQLILGMIAIFIYVGVEVTIDNNFGALLKRAEFGGLEESQISNWISLYWGSLMIGRWTGAVSVFNFSRKMKRILTIVVPFIAFGIILLVNVLKGNDVSEFWGYVICILFLIGANLYSKEQPLKLLMSVSVLAVAACAISLMTTGVVAKFAIVSCGLFASVMWPCIFAAGVAGLGKHTSQGSAFLIMMILGGAIIPPVQGSIIDLDTVGADGVATGPFTHLSYAVPLLCFLFLIWYTWKTNKELKAQGINLNDSEMPAGH